MTTKHDEPRSCLEPDPVPRRDFLGLSALWAMGGALLFSLSGMLRLPKAAVLSSPSRKFSVTLPESLATDEAYVPLGRGVALFRDDASMHASLLICTHLGCVVKAGVEGFECPCHGSNFAGDGAVTRGPAPRALDWVKASNKGGAWVVDQGTTVPAGTKEQA